MAVLVLIATAATAAQSEHMTVEVVNVPVYVSVGGTPLRGLDRERFELFVDGKRQPIEYFSVADFTAATASMQEGAVRAPQQRRLYLLLFDLIWTRPAIAVRAARAAAQLIDQAGDGDLFAVATLTARDGLQFATPFTRDRDLTHRALMMFSAPKRTVSDPLSLSMPMAARAGMASVEGRYSASSEGEAVAAAMGMDAFTDSVMQPLRDLDQFKQDALITAGDRFAGLEGLRHVVYFAEEGGAAIATGITPRHGFAPGPPQGEPRLLDQERVLFDHYRAAGVFLDAFDLGGIRDINSDFALANEGLWQLANGTGGTFVHSRNDFGPALVQMASEQQLVYLLGFKPAPSRRKASTIEVRVKDVPRNAQVSYRRGFSRVEESRPVDALRLADIVMNDVPQNGLAATIDAAAVADGFEVTVHLPSRALATMLGGDGGADLLLYVFNDQRQAIDYKTVRFKTTSQVVNGHFTLPAGTYTVKALLYVAKPESIGLSAATVTVR